MRLIFPQKTISGQMKSNFELDTKSFLKRLPK